MIKNKYMKMSGFSSRNVRYPRYQDTNLLQLCGEEGGDKEDVETDDTRAISSSYSASGDITTNGEASVKEEEEEEGDKDYVKTDNTRAIRS